MGQYKIGDEVVCKLNVGPSNDPWYQEFKLQIIGFTAGEDEYDSDELLCYVPHYISIPWAFKLNTTHQRVYSFPDKFIGEEGVLIDDCDVRNHIPGIPGATCDICYIHVQYAMTSYGTFVCHGCRENPYH